MNRNSKLAERLVRALARSGITVVGRRLERWCSDGLGAPSGLSFNAQVAHYKRLSTLSTSGRDADVAARRLASWGYPTDRLRSAVRRGMGADAPGEWSDFPRLDLSSAPDADSNFSYVEQLALAITSDIPQLPPLFERGMKALRSNAANFSQRLGESPEQIFQSFVISALCHLYGDDYYNPWALAAVMNIDPDLFGPHELDQLNAIDFDFGELDKILWSCPPQDLVAAAVLIRECAPELLEHLGIHDVEPAELEDLAGMFSPVAVWLCRTMGGHFADFPPVLPSMASPAPLPEAS